MSTELVKRTHTQSQEQQEQVVAMEKQPVEHKKLQPVRQTSMFGYVKDRYGNSVTTPVKLSKHHLSLWRDQTLMPKLVEAEKEGDIFTIIMPWVKEQQDEDRDHPKIQPKPKGPVQSTLNFGPKSQKATPTPAETKTAEKTEEPMKVIDKPKQVLKIKDVASFNFEFVARDRLVIMKDVEGILMSPKWAPHRYDTTLKQLIAVKTDEPDIITIDEFKKLKIPDTVMRDGILFIWVEKELIHEIIKFFGE